LGQQRTCRPRNPTSGIPPVTDIALSIETPITLVMLVILK
jgi:hypothetical protein